VFAAYETLMAPLFPPLPPDEMDSQEEPLVTLEL